MRKTIVMVGMMGAGKSAVGAMLARRLGVGFLDSDSEIERAANMRIDEIFARDGEPFFREKESQVLARLLAGPPVVLSTGGGAFMDEANRALIAGRGVSVWLRAEPEVLWARVKGRSTRPLLRTPDPRATLETLYARRAPVYALADVTVDSRADCSVENSVERVLQALVRRGDVTGRAGGAGGEGAVGESAAGEGAAGEGVAGAGAVGKGAGVDDGAAVDGGKAAGMKADSAVRGGSATSCADLERKGRQRP